MIDIPIIVNLDNASISNHANVILENVNLKLADGEMIYIIGKSGEGKSSLIKTLYGEIALSDGKGEVFKTDLSTLDQKSLPNFRRKLGIVFQEFHLLNHWTVNKNLEYVLRAIDWKNQVEITNRIKEVLSQIGMLDKLNEIVSKLSGGEQQKIAIARAILNKPALILADEPTGNLDPDSSDEIMYLLHKVAKENKSAIIIATHDYRLIDKFPARVYSCQKGQLIEQ